MGNSQHHETGEETEELLSLRVGPQNSRQDRLLPLEETNL